MGNDHPLDRTEWNALTTTHSRFAIGDDRVLRYMPSIGPFAAMFDTSPASFVALRALLEAHGSVALSTPDALPVPADMTIAMKDKLVQMTWQGTADPAHIWDCVQLTDSDVPDMVSLVATTKPGPFGPRTIELGSYLGVRRQGRLAAMAGERMRFDGYTEISAVCVHPDFRGQGHATGLIKLLITAIQARGDTPFLHVFRSNEGAMALYRELGFVERRERHLTVIDKATGPYA
jgi:predicted GNAT family acetyltransferase